jgi:hypothetical protein
MDNGQKKGLFDGRTIMGNLISPKELQRRAYPPPVHSWKFSGNLNFLGKAPDGEDKSFFKRELKKN